MKESQDLYDNMNQLDRIDYFLRLGRLENQSPKFNINFYGFLTLIGLIGGFISLFLTIQGGKLIYYSYLFFSIMNLIKYTLIICLILDIIFFIVKSIDLKKKKNHLWNQYFKKIERRKEKKQNECSFTNN